jgi:hypothetical protein
MPFPCRTHAVTLPCRAAKGLDCLSHLIYTVRPCLIHTCHAMPCPAMPCHDHAVLKATSQGQGTARHGHGMACVNNIGRPETACGRPALFRLLPGYNAEFYEGCYQKYTNPLNCSTSSSDISGNHAYFHEGHCTVGEWQGRCMACVN